MCVYIYIYIYIHLYVCVCVNVELLIYRCICVCVYVYVYSHGHYCSRDNCKISCCNNAIGYSYVICMLCLSVCLLNNSFVCLNSFSRYSVQCSLVTFLIIKPTGYTNSSNLFLEWNATCFGQFLCPPSGVFHCTHCNSICHTENFTNDIYGIYHCCIYSEKLLMVDRGTVRNIQHFIPRINLRN